MPAAGFAIRFKKAAKALDAAIHLPPFYDRRREKNPVNPVKNV